MTHTMNAIFYFVFLVSGTLSFNSTTFIAEIGTKLCPYTNFCHASASKTLDEENYGVPCCLPCSCSDNCWKVGNCCPDRSTVDIQTPELFCRETLVKRTKSDTKLHNGISLGIHRYRIVETCPENEVNVTLVDSCQREDRKAVDEYVWVSDKTGKIFRNRYCAYCNDVYQFTEWQVRTSYSLILLLPNFSILPLIILSADDSDLIVSVPESEMKQTEKYRCLLPYTFACNQSGLWKTPDTSLKQACETYDSPFVVDEVFSTIYKNVYCYICNGYGVSGVKGLCTDLYEPERTLTTISFSALLDINWHEQYPKQKITKSNCEDNEVFDQFMNVCHKLLCRFGSTPSDGTCKRIAMQTEGLTVQTDYNLLYVQRNNSDASNETFENLEDLAGAAFESFYKSFTVHAGNCRPCRYSIGRIADKSESENQIEIIITGTLYTEEGCQLDTIFESTIQLLNTKLEVIMNSTMRFTFQVTLEKRPINTILKFKPFYYKTLIRCSAMYRLNDERICPEVEVKSDIYMPLVEELIRSNATNIIDVADNNTYSLITICWDKYVEIMTQLHRHATSSFHRSKGVDFLVALNVVLASSCYIYL